MLEITCIYKELWNGATKDKKFNSFAVFGKWVADNATEISIIDVIQEEELNLISENTEMDYERSWNEFKQKLIKIRAECDLKRKQKKRKSYVEPYYLLDKVLNKLISKMNEIESD